MKRRTENQTQKTLEQIAAQHLGIETLQTRKRDSLDFHEVSVWGLKAALEAAYEAGVNTAKPRPAKPGTYEVVRADGRKVRVSIPENED